jgi:hypothetical protein
MRHMSLLILLFPAACGAAAEGTKATAPTPPVPAVSAAREPAAPAETTRRYTIVSLGRTSGASAVTMRPDGTRHVAFEVVENGRGPKVESDIALADDGTIRAFDATGHEELNTPIDEHFTKDAARARWKSHAESGEKEAPRAAFYVPVSPSVEAVGLLARALEKAGGVSPLLPEGEARLEKTGDLTVRANGKERLIHGYAITGLALAPERIWLDEDGAVFGTFDPIFSCVREGWESVIDTVIERQKALDRVRDLAIAKRLAKRPPAPGFAFTHARVFDPVNKKYVADQTVVVVGDKIAAVGPTKTTKPPEAAEIVDAHDKALFPGFWDMHAHLGRPDGLLDVASGVTTARDVGNDPDRLDDFKKRFDAADAVGPHVLRAGFIEGRGELAASSKVTAETEAEARAAVELYAKRGYEQIKIYNSVKPELVPVITKLAHEKGMRVSGHVPVHMRAEDAIRAGYDEINHINMVFLNFFVDKDTDTRTPLRFSLVAERAAGLDLKSKPVEDFVKLMLAKKTVLDPTLNVWEQTFTARPGEIPPNERTMTDRLPMQVRREFLIGGLPIAEGKYDTYKASFAATLKMNKKLFDSGVPLVVGTDSIAGLSFHQEMKLWSQGGIPNADVLYAATLGAARVMKKDLSTGSIAKGKDADLVLVDGDPLARIEDSARAITVVRGGVVYDATELLAAAGVQPAR